MKGPPPLPAHAELTATSTGLLLFDFEVGVGRSPDGASKVTVDYAGYLQDGTLFGYGHAVQLDLSELVEGLADGIRTMLEAGRRRIIIPSKPPGNETTATTDAGAIAESMIFDVTLLTVE